MLFLVETEQVQKVTYVVEADPPFNEEIAATKLDKMRDFSQEYLGEKVVSCGQITAAEYIELFDRVYPTAKDMDRTSKLLQISDINDTVLETILNGKDEL